MARQVGRLGVARRASVRTRAEGQERFEHECGCLHKHSCDVRKSETRLHEGESSRANSTEAYLTCHCADVLRDAGTLYFLVASTLFGSIRQICVGVAASQMDLRPSANTPPPGPVNR